MTEILILSAGRRVSLVRSFQAAADELGIVVTTADMNPEMSSACRIAEKQCQLPHVDSDNYADALTSYCADNDVRLIVPTIDTELASLAMLRGELAEINCVAVVSDPNLIEVCRDKRKTAAFFRELGIRSPQLYPGDKIVFPTFVKPYDGSLSQGASLARNADAITADIVANPKNIYCQYLDPAEYAEYTCDVYYDGSGRIKCVVPRLRVEVRGGEVSKGKTERNNIVPFLMEKLGYLPGARGCLTIQFMRHRQTHELYLIEINPRFGGGYPLTAKSGAIYHSWLIDEYLSGKTVAQCDDWQNGLAMLRYDAEIFVEP